MATAATGVYLGIRLPGQNPGRQSQDGGEAEGPHLELEAQGKLHTAESQPASKGR